MNQVDLFAYQTIGRIEWAVKAFEEGRIDSLKSLQHIKEDLIDFNKKTMNQDDEFTAS